MSTLHANFLLCGDGASAADVSALIEAVRARVLAVSGVALQEEIVRVPFARLPAAARAGAGAGASRAEE